MGLQPKLFLNQREKLLGEEKESMSAISMSDRRELPTMRPASSMRIESSTEEKVSASAASLRCTVRRSTPRLWATCSIEQRPVGSRISISSRTRLTVVASSEASIDTRNFWAYGRRRGSDMALGVSRSVA